MNATYIYGIMVANGLNLKENVLIHLYVTVNVILNVHRDHKAY